MHNTKVILKNGEELNGPMWYFRPTEGWFSIIVENEEKKINFSDVTSALTGTPENPERISINKLGVMDELERAKKYLRDARKYHWNIDENFPRFDWEDWE